MKTNKPMESERLKIAVVVRNFVTTGGAERYAFEVTRRLARDHEVHVFAQAWDEELTEGLTMHRVPKYMNKPSFMNQILFSWSVSRMVGDRFDVIHSHERIHHFDVLTIHCPCFKGYLTEKKRYWDRFFAWLSVLTSPRCLTYLWLERQQFDVVTHPKILIAVSEFVKADVQANYPVKDFFFEKAYSGVNDVNLQDSSLVENSATYRKRYGIKDDDLVLLFVGSEFRRKGLDFLLQGFALLGEQQHIKLVVVGGGDVKRYRDLAQRLGVGDRVFFTGLAKDVFAYYFLADIFIMPTLSDPGPMSSLEAMYCGVATVMSDTIYCGAAEHVKRGEAVILADPRNPEEIRRALEQLTDPDTRKQIAARGQQLASKLTWDNTAAATLAAYRRCVSMQRKKS